MTAIAVRLCRRAPALLVAVSTCLAAVAWEQPLQKLLVEPGWPEPPGRLVIPVAGLDGQGRPVPLDRADLQVFAAGSPLELIEVVAQAPAAILVVSDTFVPGVGWATLPVVQPGSRHWLGLRDAGVGRASVLPLQPAANLGTVPDVVAPSAPRLWDAVLAGLQDLALLDDAPSRRVLVVLGDLREEEASLRPMAACLEAAQELAIPIYGAVVDGAHPAAVARLKHLAESSGGDLVAAPSPLAAVKAVLERVQGAQALVLADPGLVLPAEVRVSTGAGTSGRAEVRARAAGRWSPGPGLVVAGAVVLAAAAGFVGWWRWRRRAIGWLVSVDPARPWRCAVPAAGLTIGRAPDNGLTLAETRVSKHHAIVRWRRGQVQLIDLKSTNGTQVGGRAVRTAALADGDQIVFGDMVTVQFRRRAPVPRDRM